MATEELLENNVCISLDQTERTGSFRASCARLLSTAISHIAFFWSPRGTHEILFSVVLFHCKASLLQDSDAWSVASMLPNKVAAMVLHEAQSNTCAT